jgi:RNA polymerase sigma factor (sigma-70 family)
MGNRADSDDLSLAAAIAAGDQEATETFDRNFRRKLMNIAKKRGVPWPDCEDVAQDTLVAAVSQLQRGLFRGESSLGAWLRTILHGNIEDYRRSQQRRNPSAALTRLRGNQIEVTAIESVPDPTSDPVLRLTVEQVVSRMSAGHRRILLWHLEGYTIKDMSRRLGWPSGTIGRMLAEAKEKLRQGIRSSEKSG